MLRFVFEQTNEREERREGSGSEQTTFKSTSVCQQINKCDEAACGDSIVSFFCFLMRNEKYLFSLIIDHFSPSPCLELRA